MSKLWKVAKHAYLNRVRQRSFLLLVFGVPLLIVAVGGISILIALQGGDDRPIGYVDNADLLMPEVLPALEADRSLSAPLRAYTSEDAAREALNEGEIQGYYVVPADYLTTRELSLYFEGRTPDEATRGDFEAFIRASLVAQQPADVQPLLDQGFGVTVRSADGRREISQGNVLSFILPFVAAFLLFFAVISAGSYMLQAVTEEKENRTVEVLATSLSPEQLIAGKALGLMGVSLTQLLVWGGTLAIGLFIAAQFFEGLGALAVPWGLLGLIALYFLPTFALIAGMMTAIGAMVPEMQQGQQISGLVNMLFIVPVFMAGVIIANPNSPLLIVLTLFPTTSFITLLLRWSIASVPLWQMVLSWVVVMGTAATTVWLAARIFRLGMLRYGQRLNLRHIFEGLRGQQVVVDREASRA